MRISPIHVRRQRTYMAFAPAGYRSRAANWKVSRLSVGRHHPAEGGPRQPGFGWIVGALPR
jgi:hypothetical protein